MFNLLVAYDHIDRDLGAYLQACYSDLILLLNNVAQKNIIALDGNQCTEDMIEVHTQGFNGSRFIFVGFTHGRIDSLVASHVPYINFTNAIRFQNSLFYTCACLSAVELGPELERNGCLAYIGYNTEVKMVIRFQEIFRKCKNSGLDFFLQGNRSIERSFNHMLETYETEYEKLTNGTMDNFVAAALLRSNMTSLVCLGNKELTLQDFILQ